MNKKQCIPLLCCLILGLLPGTRAFFSDYEQISNHTQIGFNDTEITEEFPSPEPLKPATESYAPKKVTITNTASVPCYIRVSLSYSNSDIGNAVTLTNLNTSEWSYLSKEENQILGGYYYYHNPVSPGASTSWLFDGISVSQLANYDYIPADGSFEVMVYEESVQQGMYTSWQNAWEIFLSQEASP